MPEHLAIRCHPCPFVGHAFAPRYVHAFLPFVDHYVSVFISVTKTDEAIPRKPAAASGAARPRLSGRPDG